MRVAVAKALFIHRNMNVPDSLPLPVVPPPLPPTPELPPGLPPAIDDPHLPGEGAPVREPTAEPPLIASR